MAIFMTCLLAVAMAMGADSFERIKGRYSTARMIMLEVDIETVSEVFDSVDSASGTIIVTDDGRYRAVINDDIYLFDGLCIWEYVPANNQVTKDCLKKGETYESELGFIKDFDRHFAAQAVVKDSVYFLKKKASGYESLPDSMTVTLHDSQLALIEYFDFNDDLNRIRIISDSIRVKIDEGYFDLALPDSVEVIIVP